ncbi:unnamed protein product [Ectocarpus sp. 13 AM-2016]
MIGVASRRPTTTSYILVATQAHVKCSRLCKQVSENSHTKPPYRQTQLHQKRQSAPQAEASTKQAPLARLLSVGCGSSSWRSCVSLQLAPAREYFYLAVKQKNLETNKNLRTWAPFVSSGKSLHYNLHSAIRSITPT